MAGAMARLGLRAGSFGLRGGCRPRWASGRALATGAAGVGVFVGAAGSEAAKAEPLPEGTGECRRVWRACVRARPLHR